MLNEAQLKKLQARHNLIDAWEKKYGEPAPRVIANFLLVAEPDEVVSRFSRNPGLHIPPQEIGEYDTAGIGWEPSILSRDDLPDFSGDPKSLAERMAPIYRQAFEEVRGRKPNAAELEAVMAVGRGETMWGTAKFPGGVGPGMYNHGAVQCHKDCDETNSFESSDTHPLDSGGSQRYVVRFRRYKNDLEGAKGLIKSVGNDPHRMLSASGNMLAAFSLGMFGNRYYEMFNATPKVLKEHAALYDWIKRNATKPPANTSQFFRDSMARAKQDNWAGRVLMHVVALNRNADATAKALGVPRATKFAVPAISALELGVAGVGAAAGMYLGGPLGAALGGVGGIALGKMIR